MPRGEVAMHWYDKQTQAPSLTLDLGLEENPRRMMLHTAADVYPLYSKLDDFMWAQGFTDKDFFFVRLALHEALSNALRHGNGLDPSKAVRVQYLVTPVEVVVEVRHQG